jgi:hypothetical protein
MLTLRIVALARSAAVRSRPVFPSSVSKLLSLSLTFPALEKPRMARSFHVDNVVGNNTPFKYEGAARKTLGFKITALMGFGFAVPFIASGYQLCVLFISFRALSGTSSRSG